MENKIKPLLLDWSQGKVPGFSGKELIQLEKGSLKLIRIEPLANYPIHLHPEKTEYAYVLEGNPQFLIEADQHTSEPGDFFIFPIGKKHAIQNKTTERCLLLIGAIHV